MLQEWTDDRLTWDPADFGNVSDIIVRADKLWLPELAVMNGSASLRSYMYRYSHWRVTLYVPDMELNHWVTGSMDHLGHLSRPGHRVIILTRCETRVFPVFEKSQGKDIKLYIFVKIRPTVIEILTFNK